MTSPCHSCGYNAGSNTCSAMHEAPQCVTGTLVERDEARALLKRISQWDMMDSAADGPFWRAEIAKVLGEGGP